MAQFNLRSPLTLIKLLTVNVPAYPVPLVKSSDLQSLIATSTTQFQELLEKKASSEDVGTAHVAPPPSVNDQFVAVFQDVLPVFLK